MCILCAFKRQDMEYSNADGGTLDMFKAEFLAHVFFQRRKLDVL